MCADAEVKVARFPLPLGFGVRSPPLHLSNSCCFCHLAALHDAPFADRLRARCPPGPWQSTRHPLCPQWAGGGGRVWTRHSTCLRAVPLEDSSGTLSHLCRRQLWGGRLWLCHGGGRVHGVAEGSGVQASQHESHRPPFLSQTFKTHSPLEGAWRQVALSRVCLSAPQAMVAFSFFKLSCVLRENDIKTTHA